MDGSSFSRALLFVVASAREAIEKHGAESVPFAAQEARLAILVEEVGEVAKAINEHDPGLRAELAQVAAVAFLWLAATEAS